MTQGELCAQRTTNTLGLNSVMWFCYPQHSLATVKVINLTKPALCVRRRPKWRCSFVGYASCTLTTVSALTTKMTPRSVCCIALFRTRKRQHWFLTSLRFHFVRMFALRSVYREDSTSVGIGEAEATYMLENVGTEPNERKRKRRKTWENEK